jgi:Xaa-Pro dipeptidase
MTEEQSAIQTRESVARIECIHNLMRRQSVDALFLTQPTNVWYTTRFWEFIPIRMEAVLVPADGDCVFIVSKNEFEYASKISWMRDVRYYTEFPEPGRHQNPYDLMMDVFRDRNLTHASIGIEETFLPIAEYRRFTQMLPRARLVDGSDILRECRMIKSTYEIELLKKSGKVAVAAWNASLNIAKPGIREYEVAQAAREVATDTAAGLFGPEDVNHSPLTDGVQLIQSGARSSISHGKGSPNRLKRGDMVAMCFCMTNQFKGYRVGVSRNFVLGSPSNEMIDVYNLLFEAQQAALSELKPGVSASYLDAIVRKMIHKAGYGQYIEHRLGRGVGPDIAERPDLKQGDDTVIEPGMTLAVDPAIYITGKWGIQIEDSVHVTPTGFEYLTVAPEPELPVI